MSKNKELGKNTKLMHAGKAPDEYYGIVNAPVSRSSTILYPSLDAYEDPDHKYRYGRYGTPITRHFESAMAELEGGFNSVVASSGLTAITTALWSFLQAGDHLLIVDSVYPPARDYCNNILSRYGVEVEYYDPLIGAGIKELIRENTAVIYMESPGSATFEIQDIPAIVNAAREKNIITMCDNSWSSGILFNPIEHGVDLCILSCSKYISGHSDIMLGAVVAASEETYKPLRQGAKDLGICAGPDDVYLALRGLRTLPMRMKQNGESAMRVVEGIIGQKAIERIYFPALPDDPNHALWKRDFSGTNGIFSILLKPSTKQAVRACVESLELFPIGSSWGGYESLLQPQYPKNQRSAVPWEEKGMLLRFQVGLEDPQDLIADLKQALDKFEF